MKTLKQFKESIDKRTEKRKRLDEALYSAIRFGSESWETFSEIVSLNNKIEKETDIQEQIKLLSAQNVEIARMVEFIMAIATYEDAQRKIRG